MRRPGDRTLPFVFASLLAAGSVYAQSPEAVPAEEKFAVEVTLEEAVSRALELSPLTVAAEGTRRIAVSARRSAYGSYLPSASADAGGTRSGSDAGTSDSYSAGVSAQWDVFTGFRRGAELRSAGARVESAVAELVEQRFAVALSVEATFYDVLRAEELLEVAGARIGRAQEGLAAAERRSSVGSGTQSDVLRSRLELMRARDSHLQFRSERNSAAHALGRFVGVKGPVGARKEGTFSPKPLAVSEAELLDELVSKTPSVRAAEAALVAARAGIASSRSAYSPALGVSAGYDWFNDELAGEGWEPGWSARAGVSVPIFDGFRREQGLVEARAGLRTAEARLADERRATRAELAGFAGELRLAEERIRLAEQAVEVATEDLRVQQERYALGVTTILELLTSQEALVEAQSGLVEARFDYRLTRAALEAVAGRKL